MASSVPGSIPGRCVSHRGEIVDESRGRGLECPSGLSSWPCRVERMESRARVEFLAQDEQLQLAESRLWPLPATENTLPGGMLAASC